MKIRVVIHASQADALERARNNALNLRQDLPEAEIRIIANAKAVAQAIEQAKPECDPYTFLCPNTLRGLALQAPTPFQVLEQGAITELVQLQHAGWIYIHA
ncbi:DsrE family protein [Alcaligenes endophyticus]|uniref:Intracellular sulfur oxidation DsrE/DsrF family protein n=1 Tax=Alcaligenes endophyticus TaxID=1929088 RepID=A0ABT8EHY3_9BURK|nr:hypothetical protein [Alcaligenes endophyticus]MCX5592698.1 hypothetical protein [Alcaligenes endophyticus]MDN4120886.1 hypothetical protein [Alcaligenes endophyticus]